MDGTEQNPGIMHLAVKEILQEINGDLRRNILGLRYLLSVSVKEIYLGKDIDLIENAVVDFRGENDSQLIGCTAQGAGCCLKQHM